MSDNWCHGDQMLCERTAGAWSVDHIADMIGKAPKDILARHPEAGEPLDISPDVIADLLPGRTVARVARLLGCSPEAVMAICNAHDLIKPEYTAAEDDRETSVEALVRAGLSDRQIADRAGVHLDTIRKVRVSAGHMRRKHVEVPWSDDEKRFLQDHYRDMSYATIGDRMGRSRNSVISQAHSLGLRKR